MDYQATLYDPLQTILGEDATITVGSTEHTVSAIDKTAGIAVSLEGDAEVQTIRPAAVVRMPELTAAGIERDDLDGETIEMNGKTWRIEATLPRPSPKGEGDGELFLILIEN